MWLGSLIFIAVAWGLYKIGKNMVFTVRGAVGFFAIIGILWFFAIMLFLQSVGKG